MVKINRQSTIFVISVIFLIGSLVACFATLEQSRFYLRGYVNPLSTLDLPYRLPRFGVNADLTQYEPEDLINQLDRMQSLGVRWVRQIVSWRQTMPAQFEYNWTAWDNIVEALAGYPGIQIIPVLVDAPDWASAGSRENAWSTPLNVAQFADFAGQFAFRYADSITYYQIWDEPNIFTGWGNENPNPIHYLALLQAAYTAIHQVDSDAHIIAAALAPTIEDGPQNISDITYLRRLYQLGIADYSDSIAAKPYGFDLPPDDRRVQPDILNFSRIIALREIMVEYGDGQKLLWASNWGWNNQESMWGNVTQDQQIDYTLDALIRAETEWPWLGGLILREWQPDLSSDNSASGFALVDVANQATPLYEALQNSPPLQRIAATNGLYRANTAYATYSGTWSFSDFGADVGWVQDSHLTFNFYGQNVGIITRQDDYVTNLFIRVNDVPANNLPHDSNDNAYLLLRSRNLSPVLENIAVATDLLLGNHLLQINADELIPDEPLHRWPIVGFAVGLDDISRPYQSQSQIAGIAVVFSLLAAVISAPRDNWSIIGQLWRPIGQLSRFIVSFMTSIALMLGMLITWHEGYPQLFRREPIQIALSIITGGLIYWNNFGLVVTFIAAGLLFLIIYNDIRIGVLLTTFWTPFFLFPVELYLFAFPMVEILLVITLLAWILRGMVIYKKQGSLQRPKVNIIDYLVVSLLILGVFGFFSSGQRGIAVTDFRTLFIQPTLLYGIVRFSGFDRQMLIKIVFVLILSAFVVTIIGLYQFFTGTYITAEGGIRRLVSVYGSPNNAALYLERILPFLLAIGLVFKKRIRIVALSCGALILVGLLLTQSAGALFLGVPALIMCVVWIIYRKNALKFLIPLALFGGVFLIIAVQSPRFERLIDVTSGTNFYRIRVWQSSLNMLADYPLTGIGLDQFLYEYRGVYILPDAWEEPNLSHPHNILFDFWLRLGILGAFFIIIMPIALVMALRKALNNYRFVDDWLFAITVGIAGSLTTVFAHGLVDNSIFVIDLAYVFMLLLGMLAILKDGGMVDAKHHIMV